MKNIREILRLKFSAKLSHRQIAAALTISPSSVSYYTRAGEKAGLTWPIPDELDDNQLWARVQAYCEQIKTVPAKAITLPDWKTVNKELRSKCITQYLLWQEYYETYQPHAYSYSQYCRLYRQWKKKQKISLRQPHPPGKAMFIDYAGVRVPIYDRHTGQVAFEAYLFIAVLGASQYTFAYATRSRALIDWIDAHVRAFCFFGGVTELIIPDNEKTASSKACCYEPQMNETYQDMARHYQTVVLATRPYQPKDKALAEKMVQIAEQWILGKLRHHRFYALAEANQAISPLLNELNQKPFQKKTGSRISLFESLDKPALKPLPKDTYCYAVWNDYLASADYHVEVNKHAYSVPYLYRNHRVRCRLTARTVEFFMHNKRIASHQRDDTPSTATTAPEHMPTYHQFHLFWRIEHLYQWAHCLDKPVLQFVKQVTQRHEHDAQRYRFHLGLLHLNKHYGESRFIAACTYALTHQLFSYQQLRQVLKNRMETSVESPSTTRMISHCHIRGASYYQGTNEKK